MKKKLLVLVLFCYLFLLNSYSINASELLKGQCGESVFWEYRDGLLRIYGNGAMTTNPWMKYKICKENIKKVIIEEGVTSVCDRAFYEKGASWECDYLSEGVAFPKTLENIGEMAFA